MPVTTRKRTLAAVVSDPTVSASTPSIASLIDEILVGLKSTTTKGDWCLREGLTHVATVDESLLPVMQRSGAPKAYQSVKCLHDVDNDAVVNMKNPSNSFESLCRIVAGQQLAGAAAQTVWRRLLETTNQDLTPQTVLDLAEESLESRLQKPVGLSGAKARSIVDLSKHFLSGDLTEAMLKDSSEADVREALLKVKGLGPWSCDMFLLFYQERPDIMPVGDLGVRKGLARHFQLKGSAKGGSLCPKKDLDKMLDATKRFAPYRSLLSYYMYRVADSADVTNAKKQRASPFRRSS